MQPLSGIKKCLNLTIPLKLDWTWAETDARSYSMALGVGTHWAREIGIILSVHQFKQIAATVPQSAGRGAFLMLRVLSCFITLLREKRLL